MSAGPLRRLVGVLGLLALLPTAGLLTTGAITVEDAAVRAAATLGVAVVLGKVAGWGLSLLATEFERPDAGADALGAGDRPGATAAPLRRASDRAVT